MSNRQRVPSPLCRMLESKLPGAFGIIKRGKGKVGAIAIAVASVFISVALAFQPVVDENSLRRNRLSATSGVPKFVFTRFSTAWFYEGRS